MRTDRLFDIILLFRDGKLWRGSEIAEKLEVSVRTIYRDIDTLVAAGIPIEGARGVGYILREPIFLPPLTLTSDELTALQLGVAIVGESGSRDLAKAAENLHRKIEQGLPTDRQNSDLLRGIDVFPAGAMSAIPSIAILQNAIATRQRTNISYRALDDALTNRTIRPLHIEFWGRVWTLTCWCEMRNGFRCFRIDRIVDCVLAGDVFEHEVGKTYADYLGTLSEK